MRYFGCLEGFSVDYGGWPSCGLHLNVDKIEVFLPQEDHRRRFAGDIARPLHGVKLLGGPASVDFDLCSELVMNRVAKTIEIMDAVARINDPQCELLLLRSCTGISRLYFTMRSCPPRVFKFVQHSFDMALRSSLERIVTASGPGFDDWQWRLATLSFAFGGLGVYSAGDVLNYAFLASRLQSAGLQTKLLRHTAYSRVFAGDIYRDHDVSCADIIAIKHRHNIVRDTLIDVCYRLGISVRKKVNIGLDGGSDKPLRPADMLLYSRDGGLDVCVDLTGSSPLTQTTMADFVKEKQEKDKIGSKPDKNGKRNSYVYDPNPNSFDFPPDSYHPSHPTYETYSYDSYGNDSQFGYDCQPQFPLNLSIEEPDNSLSMEDEHLDTIPVTESDEASPPDSELVSSEVMEIVISEVGGIDDEILLTIKDDILREKLLNVNLLIAKIEALNANPTPSFDCKTKSPSTSLNSLLEETNTSDNSLPEFEAFYFDVEEISSGSTTTHSDISLPEYEVFHDDHVKEISSGSPTTHFDSSLYASFIFDLSINPFCKTHMKNTINLKFLQI
nr:hypothetical protein [Tanacetum cinerariifolium]